MRDQPVYPETGQVTQDGKSLAEQQYELLSTAPVVRDGGGYTSEDARRLLRGGPIDPAAAAAIHSKMLVLSANPILAFLRRRYQAAALHRGVVIIRPLADGESSASVMPYVDHSVLLLVSHALQEALIALANAVVFLDTSTTLARLSRRRRKRTQVTVESVADVIAAIRLLLIVQRTTGQVLHPTWDLDEQSFELAGQMAMLALQFVVAHELSHIAHGHISSADSAQATVGHVNQSIVQELQADGLALRLLKDILEEEGEREPETQAMWAAFLALTGIEVTENALYVRRNSTHPEPAHRWALIEHQAATRPRAVVTELREMTATAIVGASRLTKPLSEERWSQLWSGQRIRPDPTVKMADIMKLDRLNATPLDALANAARAKSTATGIEVLDHLQAGQLATALGLLGVSQRQIAVLSDRSCGLTFHTLKSIIETSPNGSVASSDASLFSITCARIACEHVSGKAGS
jgi:hypothetical protein